MDIRRKKFFEERSLGMKYVPSPNLIAVVEILMLEEILIANSRLE
jgi:hypothetical protein